MNAAKRRALLDMRSALEESLDVFLAEWPGDLVTLSFLRTHLSDQMGQNVNEQHLRQLFKERGIVRLTGRRPRIAGAQETIVALSQKAWDAWQGQPKEAVERHINEARAKGVFD